MYATLRPALLALFALLLLAPTAVFAGEEEPIDLGALEEEEDEASVDGEAPGAPDDEADFDVVEQLGAGSGIRVATICTNCNAANLSVNGLSGDRVGAGMDGVPAAGGLNTVFWLTQFPSDFIGYTGVRRGPGSVLTGADAYAGTIDFHLPELDEERQLVQLEAGSWSWTQLKTAYTNKWGPVGMLLFAQAAQQDVVDANGDTFNEVADFNRQTFDLALKFDLTDHQTLTVKGSYYDEDQLDGPGAPFDRDFTSEGEDAYYVDEDAFFNWKTFAAIWEFERPNGFRAKWHGRFSKRNQAQWSVGDAPRPGEEQDDNLQVKTYDISDELSNSRLTFEAPIGTAGYITGGIGYDLQRLRVKQLNDGFNPYWIVDALEQRELFIQYERSLGSQWDYTVGLRYDTYDIFGKNEQQTLFDPEPVFAIDYTRSYDFLSPRFQAHYRPNAKVVLGLAAGRGILGPKPSFSETCCGAKYQRNLDLRPESAWSYQLQAEFKPTPDQRFTVTGFWSDITDYHEKIVYKSSVFIPYYSTRALQSARVRGFDMVHDMRFKGDNFNLGWTYTYTDSDGDYSTAKDPSYGSDDPAQQWETSGLRYTPEHVVTAYLRYNNAERGTTVSFDLSYQGSVSHFKLEEYRPEYEPWEFLESESFTTANVNFEQRVGTTAFSFYGGITNIGDYTMPDLGQLDSSNDWGPITGRFFYAGVKYLR